MIINFISWAPLISLLSLSLLHPLKVATRNATAIRIYNGIFLLPALAAAFILLKLATLNSLIASKSFSFTHMPIIFSFQIDQLNSLIIASLLLLMARLIFFLPDKNLTPNLSTAAFTFAWLVIVCTASDLMIKIAAFSIGHIAITFIILNDECDRSVVRQLLSDFIPQRASDIMAFIALIAMMADLNLTTINSDANSYSHVLLFFSIALRVFSTIALGTNYPLKRNILFKKILLQKLYLGIGPIILALFTSTSLNIAKNFYTTFFITAVILLLFALYMLIFHRHPNSWQQHLHNLMVSGALIASCVNYRLVATIILCAILFIHPFLSSSQEFYYPKATPKNHAKAKTPLFLSQVIFQWPIKMAYFFAKIFINFIYPIYAIFLLYRLPQIILNVVQIPIRFFHNGNIQRSMIFVSLMTILYWWGMR